ncbi:MAG: hypothetical protein Q9221_003295 [Calogaya cf. arnoldii]
MLTAYRAALPATALLSSLIAFALAICCFFAGKNPATLQNMELFTINTSRIGPHLQQQMGLPPPDSSFNITSVLLPRDLTDELDEATDSLLDERDLFSDGAKVAKDPKAAIEGVKANLTKSVDDGKKALTSAGNQIKDNAKNATAKIVSTFINETISTLDIQDFYHAHLTTYCSGLYSNGGGKKNITYCSNDSPQNSSTAANPIKENNPFAFINDLHLPDPISYAMKAVTLLSNLISYLYILGFGLLVLSMVASILSIISSFIPLGGSSLYSKVNLAATITAFLCVLLGTILANLLSRKIVEAFASNEGSGVQASAGKNFMGVSIAAVVFTGIAATLVVVDVVTGKAADKVSGVGKRAGIKVAKRMWFGRKGGKKEGWELDERV